MSAATASADRPPALRLYHPGRPAGPSPSVAWFTINGFPARLELWTAEEWADLADRPGDAVALANGCRVAFRIA